jgi:hypothetical protein
MWPRSATLLNFQSLAGEGINYGSFSDFYIEMLYHLKNILFWKAVHEVGDAFSGS